MMRSKGVMLERVARVLCCQKQKEPVRLRCVEEYLLSLAEDRMMSRHSVTSKYLCADTAMWDLSRLLRTSRGAIATHLRCKVWPDWNSFLIHVVGFGEGVIERGGIGCWFSGSSVHGAPAG